jgi:hypothetical protein
LGLDVDDDPDAFSRINAGSLVFHVATYLFIAWWISDGIWPAAMVCSNWGDPEPILVKHHPAYCAPDVHAMFQEYDTAPFIDADSKADDGWSEVGLYWKKHDSLTERGKGISWFP